MWRQCIEIAAVLNCLQLYSTIHWLLSAHRVCVLWNSSYHMSCHVIHTMSCEPRSKSCHVIHTIFLIMSNDHMSHDHIIFDHVTYDHVTWLGEWYEQLKINVPNVFNYTCSKKFKLALNSGWNCLFVCVFCVQAKVKTKVFNSPTNSELPSIFSVWMWQSDGICLLIMSLLIFDRSVFYIQISFQQPQASIQPHCI